MQLSDLNKLLEKVEKGKASSEEIASLEQFADRLSKDGNTEVFKSEQHKKAIHDELRKRVELPVESTGTSWYKVAAGLAVLLSLSAALWFGYNYWDNSVYIVEQTLPGEKKVIVLPDGSEVSLNGASTLKYKPISESKERRVHLIGEAFFKVAQDPLKPFTVESNNVTTTVHGTEFNVNAFLEDSAVVVSLTEGSVMVEAYGRSEQLKPMEQAIVDATREHLATSTFDSTDAAIAWLTGDVVLSKMTLDRFTRFVERKYGIKVLLESEAMKEYSVSGRFKNPSVELLIASVATAKNLEFSKESKSTYILKTK